MARLVLVALVWSAVRADEYDGASMPVYGDSAEYAVAASLPGSAPDYRGHSPDAPAPLDYKYEEEQQGNTEKSTKDTIDLSDSWKRPARKQRGLRRDRDEPSDGGADVESQLKAGRRRHMRHRARPEGGPPREAGPVHRRRRGRRGRSRDHYPLTGDYVDKGHYRADNNKILDEDVDTFTPRETTEIIKRRKPRDGLLNTYVKPLKNDDLDSDEDLLSDRKVKSSSMERVEEGRGGAGGARFGERERVRYRSEPAPPPVLPEDEDEDDDVVERPRGRHKPGEYHAYDDNYDMRRLHNIKSKLPMLLRRTTTRSPLPGESSATTSDLLSLLWTARRARPAAATYAPTPTEALLPPNPDPELDHVPGPARGPDPPDTTTIITTTTKTTPIPMRTFSKSTSELSMAEKSRLSILKKSQKKENEKGEPSKKPPVLLQVTSKMPTVVMVEPPTSADPWMRARHISNDSPQKLEKVKRLMRHKLVAGAKSIQDLTDNWDDMVCDYIDVSLLDIAIEHKMSFPLLSVTLAFVLVVQ